MEFYKNVFLALSTALILLAAISSTQGNKCSKDRSKNLRASWKELVKDGECKPVIVPVPVEVPGYNVMTPNTVMLKRCHSFHGCAMRHCIPKMIEEKDIKVEGYAYGMKNAKCMVFKTVEHVGCKCGCQPDMCDPKLQDYDESMCKCTCKKKVEQDCKALVQLVGPSKMMYYPNKCVCPCTNSPTCANGEMFDKNMCKCVSTSQMMGQEFTQTKQ